MYHFVTEMCTPVHISVPKWSIVGYRDGAMWVFFCNGSVMCSNVISYHMTRYQRFFCKLALENNE